MGRDPTYDPDVHGSVSAAPPGDMGWRVEELFDRPDTAGRCDEIVSGDGLGSTAVWPAFSGLDNPCPKIKEGSGYFRLSSTAAYTGHEAGSFNTFAEAFVRVDLTTQTGQESDYNFQVEAKVGDLEMYTCDLVNTTVTRSYAAKLILGPRHCHQPMLFLVRGPEQYGLATCVDLGNGDSQPMYPEFGGECTNLPPLVDEDPDNLGKSEPVWLRIEARDLGQDVELRRLPKRPRSRSLGHDVRRPG